MIEANEPTGGAVVKQATPTTISTTMIIEDLENGISRDGIKEKYSLETWEVTQMFQHPTLKGKKAKKVRKLSFEFVDDVTEDTSDPNLNERAAKESAAAFKQTFADAQEALDPNQTVIDVQEVEFEAEEVSFEEEDNVNEFNNN